MEEVKPKEALEAAKLLLEQKPLEETALPPEMSPEDKAWLETVPPMLRGVAARHGKQLFQLVMQSGSCTFALGQITSQGRGNRAILQAALVLQRSLNDLAQRALQLAGKTSLQFQECHADIERAAALADIGQIPANASVSKGGIILNS